MAKEKQIQMPESWFMAVVRYMYGAEQEKDFIIQGIQDKMKRTMEHDLYSVMHDTSKTREEREKARKKYLESKGIPESFQW